MDKRHKEENLNAQIEAEIVRLKANISYLQDIKEKHKETREFLSKIDKKHSEILKSNKDLESFFNENIEKYDLELVTIKNVTQKKIIKYYEMNKRRIDELNNVLHNKSEKYTERKNMIQSAYSEFDQKLKAEDIKRNKQIENLRLEIQKTRQRFINTLIIGIPILALIFIGFWKYLI